jgi:predicted transcriptional regulator
MSIKSNSPIVEKAIQQYLDRTSKTNLEIHWNEDKQKFFIDTITKWITTTDDGRTYWEEDVSNHEELTWNEFIEKSIKGHY